MDLWGTGRQRPEGDCTSGKMCIQFSSGSRASTSYRDFREDQMKTLSGERQNRTAFPGRNLPIISRPLAPARRSLQTGGTVQGHARTNVAHGVLFGFGLASGRREGECFQSVPACVDAAAIFQRNVCAVDGTVGIGGVSTACFGHTRSFVKWWMVSSPA
jgi:hypothetical protein